MRDAATFCSGSVINTNSLLHFDVIFLSKMLPFYFHGQNLRFQTYRLMLKLATIGLFNASLPRDFPALAADLLEVAMSVQCH